MGAPQYEQAGADIGGTGTTNTIPRWTGPSTLGDSGLIDNGTAIYTTTRNVGIGTASPGALLDVSSGKTVGTGGFRVGADVSATTRTNNTRKIGSLSVPHYDNTASDASLMAMDANTTTNTLYIGGGWSQNAATSILFYTGATSTTTTGSERARIDSAGNFGIGNASPSSYDAGARNLVVGSGTGNQGITIAGSGNLNLYFATGTTGGDPYRGYIRYTAAGDAFTFATASTVRASLGGSSLDISSTAGYGLKLPATPGNADTQTLDCYAETTLNSGFTTSGITSTGTFTVTARATRIGRSIALTVKITPSGGASLTFASGWYVTLTGIPQMPDIAAFAAISNDATGARGSIFCDAAATPTIYGGTAGAYALGTNISLLVSGIVT